MKKLKLTAPTLLVMGRTGRLGNNETNQNKDAPNLDEVRQQVEILLRSHDEQSSTSVLLKVNADGTFTFETTLNTTREVKRFKANWKMEGKSVTLDFSKQTNIYKKMKTIDDEFEVNEDDDEMDGMYPVGLKMREDNNDDNDNENDRNVLNDDDNNDPLDRNDDEGMYPQGVR